MKSLFVVSLPRSLSTRVYHLARDVLGLAEPAWTSDGEILNFDRRVPGPSDEPGDAVKFTHPERRPHRFARLLDLLGRSIARRGFAYKDVVQPFVTAAWLPASGLPVLKIDRPLAEVAHNMIERGWLYPAQAAGPEEGPGEESARRVIAGLAHAREALAQIPGATVRFDDLIAGEEALTRALSTLYDTPVAVPAYVDEEFRRVREVVLARRESPDHRRIADLCREVAPE